MRFAMLLAVAAAAGGQPLSVGIKAGGIATGALDPFADHQSEAKRYTFGPAVEVGLPWKLRLEVNALYKRAGDRGGDCVFTFCSISQARANVWELPLLVKRRFFGGPARPFASGGYAFRRIGRASGVVQRWRTGPLVTGEQVDYTIHRDPLSQPGENTHGLVAAGGLEFKAGRIRLAPEFRYTRWNRRYWEAFGSRGFFTGSNLNQAELLLGLYLLLPRFFAGF